MKHNLLFIFFLFFCFATYGQGIFLDLPEKDLSTSQGVPFEVPIVLYNDYNHNVKVIVEWKSQSIELKDHAEVLFGKRLIDSGKLTIEMKAGEEIDDLNARFTFLEGLEDRRYTIKITDLQNHQDIQEELVFTVAPVDMDQYIYLDEHLQVGTMYPNPINTSGWLQYELFSSVEAKIVVHNVLGTQIGEFALSPFDNKVKIQVGNYKEGVYFYSLIVDGQSKATRKIVVQR
ncbi:T9SS type A sorting domain-containing protein [Persicobacter sp. CCB-QB2]|uniref:T9SS type A sorting domain-containing protein n=1 Tax=Persicobacter sp. CCB-QB2 TaxID=1561025 RepID=UPI0006A9C884|nr:T9SS type A sorting domain-containing protein [Persicobacter sp. CCB-QB2]